jgi:hypothetical protein
MPVIHSANSEQSQGSIKLVRQYDIAELMMKKYQLQIDQREFIVFYRIITLGEDTGSESSSEDHNVNVTSIYVDQKKTALVITVDNVEQSDVMSVRFPQELISAEKGKFTILADGKERGYEMSTQEESRSLIFVIPEHTSTIEIVGTKVIPEFPSAVVALIIVSSVLLLMQGLNKKPN